MMWQQRTGENGDTEKGRQKTALQQKTTNDDDDDDEHQLQTDRQANRHLVTLGAYMPSILYTIDIWMTLNYHTSTDVCAGTVISLITGAIISTCSSARCVRCSTPTGARTAGGWWNKYRKIWQLQPNNQGKMKL